MLRQEDGPHEPPASRRAVRIGRRPRRPRSSSLVCVVPGLLDGQHLVAAAPRDPLARPDLDCRFGGTLDNYRRVFEGDALPRRADHEPDRSPLATVVVALVFAFLAARRGDPLPVPRPRRASSSTLLLIQMIPVEGLFISQYKMLEGLQLLNTVAGLTLVYVATRAALHRSGRCAASSPACPYELEEAAMIDGCSRFQAFLRITFPLLAPGPGRDRRLRVHPGLERVHPRRSS